MTLTGRQKQQLFGRAQRLKPVVIVGGAGLNDGVLQEIERALEHHELIKVRVNAADRAGREQLIERICAASGANLVKRVGHVATLFRRNPGHPVVPLS
ncbi:MAG: RNA-binding protein [Chromatiales bacterium 21-64-14]|nr:MAG: RNA-binding protein [Chromatiales bacterium 21-64-14]HQU15428.1 ribosome assembly RNA-binding protein YhbY [Gammaproteobacteria bacterium]